MAAICQDFTIYSGDYAPLLFTTTDGNGNAYDLTGIQGLEWAMSPDNAISPAALTKTLGNGITVNSPATAGKFTVTLSSANTTGIAGRYYHEARIIDNSGLPRVIATGYVNINPSNI